MRLSWLFEWMRASGKKFVAAHLKWPGVSLNDTRSLRDVKKASHLSAGMSILPSMYDSYRSDIGIFLPDHWLASVLSSKVMKSLSCVERLREEDWGPSETFF